MRCGARGLAAAIFVFVALVFSGSFTHEFVRLDDYEYVVMNPHIKDGLTAKSVVWAFGAAGYAANWHPLAWLSHAADISLAKALGVDYRSKDEKLGLQTQERGGLAKIAHIHNVLLHALNAVLLFALMLGLGQSVRSVGEGSAETCGIAADSIRLLAAFLTLLWAVHPLRVEVVAWVSERKELVSCLFMLATLNLYVRGRRGWSAPCFALALLAKPVAVSLPAVILAYEWVLKRTRFVRSALRALPFAVLSGAVCLLTLKAQTGAMRCAEDWTWVNRLLSVVEAPVIYLGQTLWPFNLTVDYAVPTWSSWPIFALGVLLLLAMAAAVARWFWSARADLLVFAIAWVYVGLLPMIGIVKVGYEPHNDRYTYWIGAGVVCCLMWQFQNPVSAAPSPPIFGRESSRKRRRGRRRDIYGKVLKLPLMLAARWALEKRSAAGSAARRVGAAAGAVLIVLSVMSVALTRTWRDSETLFLRAVQFNHDPIYAQALAEVMAIRHPDRQEAAVEILSDVLSVRQTPLAQAILAYQMAAYAKGVRYESVTGRKASAFAEARALADQALREEPSGRTAEFACAAFAFADHREERPAAALTWLRRAIECGFEPKLHNVDVAAWEKLAKEAGAGAGPVPK